MRIVHSILILFCVSLFGILWFSWAAAFNINPSQPVKGDTITLTGTCTPGADVPISLEFSRDVGVSGGEYEYDLGTIKLPTSTTLRITAQDVKNLKLGWKVLIWFTITIEGSGGTAAYSRSMPSGNYHLKVFGDAAAGADTVHLDFTAETSITCDGAGNLLYTYDSGYLPLGVYVIDVQGERKTVELLSERPPTTTLIPTLTPSPTPPPTRTFYLVANDIDYSLSKNLIDGFGSYALEPARTLSPVGCTLILGGPDAPDGVGEVTSRHLEATEEKVVRKKGSKEFFKRDDIFIVAGSDRYMTQQAFSERFIEVAANLISCVEASTE